MSEQVQLQCAPTPLTVKGGKVEADVAVTYPKDFFNSKALMEVTPVLVYDGGELAAEPLMLQGEKVRDNYRVVPVGGSKVTRHVVFPYAPGITENCHLELRERYSMDRGKTWVDLSTRKLVEGCNINETLASFRGYYDPKPHNYQPILMMTEEGQVMYNINSAEVRKSEIEGQSIGTFADGLRDALQSDRKNVKNVEVLAYASPEGKEDFNKELSTDRSQSARKAFDKITRNEDMYGIKADIKSVGEDWVGFQDLVAASNIEDKDLILRVLSMYNDSNVREQEIRNMSSIFQDLAKDVLPQLRRARFIANVQFINYSDDELRQMIKDNSDVLDEEALLKAAELCKSNADKKTVLGKAVEKFGSQRAKFNLACVALDEDDLATARDIVSSLDAKDKDVENLQGVIAVRQGDWKKAAPLFEDAEKTVEDFDGNVTKGSIAAHKNVGLTALHDGRYSIAAAQCGNAGIDAAVAKLLAGDAEGSLKCLEEETCPKADYIRALCYKRLGQSDKSAEALKKACEADPALAKRAATDIEFTNKQ